MTTGTNATRNEYITRESILKLLSNEEVTNVSSSETAIRLADGDEFLDLGDIDRGVQCAPVPKTSMGRVLSKCAVSAATWGKILAVLAAPHPRPRQSH